jgi:hypothetical protein
MMMATIWVSKKDKSGVSKWMQQLVKNFELKEKTCLFSTPCLVNPK